MSEEQYWLNKDGFAHTEHQERMAFIIERGCELMRPCVIWKPRVYPNGDQWCALYGDNLQDGVAGFGKSPSLALKDFDTNWIKEKP